MADLSVSAICLPSPTSAKSMAALVGNAVVDLHCDIFPDLPGAPTMSVDQVGGCQQLWPHSITVHVWSRDPTSFLRSLAPREGDRVLIQDLPDAPEWPAHVKALTDRGWKVGLGILAGADFTTLPNCSLSAVQVLTTNTPGRAGGWFDPRSYDYLTDLRRRRAELDADWSIEADGGISNQVAVLLDQTCDRLVLGTNGLVESYPGGPHIPHTSMLRSAV